MKDDNIKKHIMGEGATSLEESQVQKEELAWKPR